MSLETFRDVPALIPYNFEQNIKNKGKIWGISVSPFEGQHICIYCFVCHSKQITMNGYYNQLGYAWKDTGDITANVIFQV